MSTTYEEYKRAFIIVVVPLFEGRHEAPSESSLICRQAVRKSAGHEVAGAASGWGICKEMQGIKNYLFNR